MICQRCDEVDAVVTALMRNSESHECIELALCATCAAKALIPTPDPDWYVAMELTALHAESTMDVACALLKMARDEADNIPKCATPEIGDQHADTASDLISEALNMLGSS